MPVPALGEQESAKLPLNEQDAAKLALTEPAKKISDLKTRQWEIAKNAVIILAFLAAVSRGELKYPKHWDWLLYAIPCLVFAYFCTIFWQVFSNTGRYMTVYRKAAQKLFSLDAFELYSQKDPGQPDRGRGPTLHLLVFCGCCFVLVSSFSDLRAIQQANWGARRHTNILARSSAC